jgi:hypothetical protein
MTVALRGGITALPPIADMCGALAYVRFGPKVDITAHGFGYDRVDYSASGTTKGKNRSSSFL